MDVLPRKPEMLQYVVRIHLRVGAKDMTKVLRKMTVRPFVLLALLHFLIDHHHVVFRGHGTTQELKRKMDAAVADSCLRGLVRMLDSNFHVLSTESVVALRTLLQQRQEDGDRIKDQVQEPFDSEKVSTYMIQVQQGPLLLVPHRAS